MDPTKISGGVPENLHNILALAKAATDQTKAATVELHIAYNMQTGEMQMAGPRDPLLFYGILGLARESFDAEQGAARAKAIAESERRIKLAPGALAEEVRQ